MARAVQQVVKADEIAFELERFELEEDRLELSGRWFGVRGRRFVRPALTPLGAHELSRVLADLEHKPWAAEDGEQWEAAFPWDQGSDIAKFELSVAPDITIPLPAPGGKLGRPRRLAALPRNPAMEPAWPQPMRQRDEAEFRDEPEPEPAPPQREQVDQPQPTAAPEPEAERLQAAAAPEPEAERLQAAAAPEPEAERLQADLDALSTQLEAANAEVDALRHQLSDREAAIAQLDQTQREVTELRSQLAEARLALEEAGRQRDEAIRAHGAAIVMRRATRAASYPAGARRSWQAVLAVLALVAAVVVVLVVVHVL